MTRSRSLWVCRRLAGGMTRRSIEESEFVMGRNCTRDKTGGWIANLFVRSTGEIKVITAHKYSLLEKTCSTHLRSIFYQSPHDQIFRFIDSEFSQITWWCSQTQVLGEHEGLGRRSRRFHSASNHWRKGHGLWWPGELSPWSLSFCLHLSRAQTGTLSSLCSLIRLILNNRNPSSTAIVRLVRSRNIVIWNSIDSGQHAWRIGITWPRRCALARPSQHLLNQSSNLNQAARTLAKTPLLTPTARSSAKAESVTMDMGHFQPAGAVKVISEQKAARPRPPKMQTSSQRLRQGYPRNTCIMLGEAGWVIHRTSIRRQSNTG